VELTVLQQVTALGRMPLPQLRDTWKVMFGREAPAAYKPDQLVRRLAWRVQEIHFGGLSRKTRQAIDRIAAEDDLANGRRPAPVRRAGALAPGTRLVRSWGGADHVVVADARGRYEYTGRQYRTLTAVAKAITGQHVSGPRFFGLVARKESRT
jgi:hypothetical protein